MFKAILNNEIIFSFDIINKHKKRIHELEDLYRTHGHNKEIFCSECGDPVLLKAGDLNVPHFSHYKRNYSCHVNKQKSFESEEHKVGIMLIYNYLKHNGTYEILDIDYKLPFRRRANIYIKNDKEFALEIVANPMQYHAWRKKHQDYLDHNIIPLWILSKKSFSEMNQEDYNFFERTVELEDSNGVLYILDTDKLTMSFSKYMPFLVDGEVYKRDIYKEEVLLEDICFDQNVIFNIDLFINNYWESYSDYITEAEEVFYKERKKQKVIDEKIKNRIATINQSKSQSKEAYAICLDCGSYTDDYWYLEPSGKCRCYCTIKKRGK